MPRIPMYTLVWSNEKASYELFAPQKREVLQIEPGSSAWFAWLDTISCFSFVGQSCHYTARKEARQRGESYWYAYQTVGARIKKRYLGKSANVTLARLEYLAEMLRVHHSGVSVNLPETPQGTIFTQNDGERAPLIPSPEFVSLAYPLLMTKLHIPRLQPHMVARNHLVERLQQGATRPLTLISAPAGFGKTTLLTQWISASSMPVAWLSLEPNDNDPLRFLFYLIAALQTLDPQVGTKALALLHALQPPHPEDIITVLVNELVQSGAQDKALILDDYHVITAEPLQRGMAFLLDHLPMSLHLILATRSDPALPLNRLRARGLLVEIRATNMRFTSNEVHAFLKTTMGLELPLQEVGTLEQYTEGWVTGLQLAALSLQGGADHAQFLTNFKGTHRLALEYLSEEVLMQQSSAVQTFLLHTSVLDRLNASLCDAVTGQKEGQEILERLEKMNLFVVSLDEVRGWYRYHHLFAEALLNNLQQRESTLLPTLHRRASGWYEQHNLPFEAVHHALAIPDEERAIRLIEPLIVPLAFQSQRSTVIRWLSAIPESTLRGRPLLSAYYASLFLLTNQFEIAERHLQEAEAAIEEKMPAEQVRLIQGFVLTVRSTIAFFSGNLICALPLARQALGLLPEADDLARAGVLANLAHAYQVSGETTPTVEQEITRIVTTVRALHNPFATASSIACLAHLYVLQGRPYQAFRTYSQILQTASSQEKLQATYTGPYYSFGLGNLLYEWHDLETAEQHLRQGIALIQEDLPLEPWIAMQGYTTLALLLQMRGDGSEASEVLDALRQLAQKRNVAALFQGQIAAWQARLDLAQGNLMAATRWAETCGISPGDATIPYPREDEYLILARIRIAQAQQAPIMYPLQDILTLLERLRSEAETKARYRSVLAILMVRLLALEAQGNHSAVLLTLAQMLQIAEQGKYIQCFLDEGRVMQRLLQRSRYHGMAIGYITTLLNAFTEQSTPDFHPQIPPLNLLVEPLTEREREVLGLLLEGASNREIAERLVLSVNTVKRHVYNMCRKLGVRTRLQAMTYVQSLKLL